MAMEEIPSSYFKVSLPDEFLPVVKNIKSGKNVDEKVRVSLAVGLFVGKSVTLAKAAELAGKSLSDFIDLLRDSNIAWMEYTDEHFEDDLETVGDLLGEQDGKAK